MTTSRNDISKLIAKIQKNNSVLDSIKPSLFESVVAEAITRNNKLIKELWDVVQKIQQIEKNIFSSFMLTFKNFMTEQSHRAPLMSVT